MSKKHGMDDGAHYMGMHHDYSDGTPHSHNAHEFKGNSGGHPAMKMSGDKPVSAGPFGKKDHENAFGKGVSHDDHGCHGHACGAPGHGAGSKGYHGEDSPMGDSMSSDDGGGD